MTCIKSLETIVVKKWDKLTKELILQFLSLALSWEFWVEYQDLEYVEQANKVYKSLSIHTADATNKPWEGVDWETYWELIDDSIVDLIEENYYVSQRQDITNFVITMIVRLASTLDDPDDTTALFEITATATNPLQWKAEFLITEIDNGTVWEYIYEIEITDTAQPIWEQKTSNINYWTYIIQEEAKKD